MTSRAFISLTHWVSRDEKRRAVMSRHNENLKVTRTYVDSTTPGSSLLSSVFLLVLIQMFVEFPRHQTFYQTLFVSSGTVLMTSAFGTS